MGGDDFASEQKKRGLSFFIMEGGLTIAHGPSFLTGLLLRRRAAS